MPFVWTFFVADYQVERFSVLVPTDMCTKTGLGSGYNNIQAEIAITLPCLTGTGLTKGQQTQLRYLKVPTKDFIFSVLGEERGFVGAMAGFALFIALLMRGIRAAQIAGDQAGKLIAVGIRPTDDDAGVHQHRREPWACSR